MCWFFTRLLLLLPLLLLPDDDDDDDDVDDVINGDFSRRWRREGEVGFYVTTSTSCALSPSLPARVQGCLCESLHLYVCGVCICVCVGVGECVRHSSLTQKTGNILACGQQQQQPLAGDVKYLRDTPSNTGMQFAQDTSEYLSDTCIKCKYNLKELCFKCIWRIVVTE